MADFFGFGKVLAWVDGKIKFVTRLFYLAAHPAAVKDETAERQARLALVQKEADAALGWKDKSVALERETWQRQLEVQQAEAIKLRTELEAQRHRGEKLEELFAISDRTVDRLLHVTDTFSDLANALKEDNNRLESLVGFALWMIPLDVRTVIIETAGAMRPRLEKAVKGVQVVMELLWAKRAPDQEQGGFARILSPKLPPDPPVLPPPAGRPPV